MGITWRTTASVTDTSTTVLQTAAAGVYHYLTDIIVVNSDTTDAAVVTISSGSTAIGYIYADPGAQTDHTFKVPLVTLEANKGLRVANNVAASTVYYTACGFNDTK